jgi:hypothetical protein
MGYQTYIRKKFSTVIMIRTPTYSMPPVKISDQIASAMPNGLAQLCAHSSLHIGPLNILAKHQCYLALQKAALKLMSQHFVEDIRRPFYHAFTSSFFFTAVGSMNR